MSHGGRVDPGDAQGDPARLWSFATARCARERRPIDANLPDVRNLEGINRRMQGLASGSNVELTNPIVVAFQ
jgi:hypothetical protein